MVAYRSTMSGLGKSAHLSLTFRSICLVTLMVVCFSIPCLADGTSKQGSSSVDLPRFVTIDGNVVDTADPNLSSLCFVFLGTECPISNRSVPSLNKIYAQQGHTKLVAVVADPLTSRREVIEFRDKFQIKFEIVFDASLQIARLLKPTHFPEAFVLKRKSSNNFDLLYRGAIDDSWAGLSRPKAKTNNQFLNDVLTAVSKNTAIDIGYRQPYGCIFEALTPKKTQFAKSVSYRRHIAEAVQASCLDCHSQSEHFDNFQGFKKLAQSKSGRKFISSAKFGNHWDSGQIEYKLGPKARVHGGLSEQRVSLFRNWLENDCPLGEFDDKVAARSSKSLKIEARASKLLRSKGENTLVSLFSVDFSDSRDLFFELRSNQTREQQFSASHFIYRLANKELKPDQVLKSCESLSPLTILSLGQSHFRIVGSGVKFGSTLLVISRGVIETDLRLDLYRRTFGPLQSSIQPVLSKGIRHAHPDGHWRELKPKPSSLSFEQSAGNDLKVPVKVLSSEFGLSDIEQLKRLKLFLPAQSLRTEVKVFSSPGHKAVFQCELGPRLRRLCDLELSEAIVIGKQTRLVITCHFTSDAMSLDKAKATTSPEWPSRAFAVFVED